MLRYATNIVAAGGVLVWAATTATGQEESPAVPSGIHLELQEIRLELGSDDALARFRYVAPDLDHYAFVAIEEDFPALCTDHVLPWARTRAESVTRVVISFASVPVEFGAATPGVTQFFEQFRLENDACIWEGL